MAKYGLDFGTTTTKLTTSTARVFATKPGADPLRVSPSVGEHKSLKRELYRGTAEGKLAPEKVDAAILEFFKEIMKEAAALGVDLSEAGSVRLGSPAIWDSEARRRLVGLATKAGMGLDDFTIVEEASAAGAGWFSLLKQTNESKRALVFDMGGGTLDVAVIEIDAEGSDRRLNILSCVGNAYAGDFFDNALRVHVSQKHALDDSISYDWSKAKHDLDKKDSATLSTPNGAATKIIISKSDLSSVAQESGFLAHTRATIERAVRLAIFNAGIEGVGIQASLEPYIRQSKTVENPASSIDSVILVGGMQRAPILRELLLAMFPSAAFYVGAEITKDVKKLEAVDLDARFAVASGMMATSVLESANLARWPYEVYLEFPGHKMLLIDAYADLIDPEMFRNNGPHVHITRFLKGIPNSGFGKIVVRSLNGSVVNASWQNDEDSGDSGTGPMPFEFGQYTGNVVPASGVYEPRLVFYPQGVVRIYDGNGGGRKKANGPGGSEQPNHFGGKIMWFTSPYWRKGASDAAKLKPDAPAPSGIAVDR